MSKPRSREEIRRLEVPDEAAYDAVIDRLSRPAGLDRAGLVDALAAAGARTPRKLHADGVITDEELLICLEAELADIDAELADPRCNGRERDAFTKIRGYTAQRIAELRDVPDTPSR